MPRPQRCRRICREPACQGLAPIGCPAEDYIVLTRDEYEVLRLVDYLHLTHEQCAARMDISRTTVTEICDQARFKLTSALVNGWRLEVRGGNIRVCQGDAPCRRCPMAPRPSQAEFLKGAATMRIAVTYENGQVFQHFGHTQEFKVYDVADGKVVSSRVMGNQGQGHGALATLLQGTGVDVLICGGIGPGAKTALSNRGIELYGGVTGSADAAVEALLAGTLAYNPDVSCDHHDHDHGHGHEEDHACGHHGHGCES